jgi:hypothetical protein
MNYSGTYLDVRPSSLLELRAAYFLGSANWLEGHFFQVSRALPQDQQRAYSLAWAKMLP